MARRAKSGSSEAGGLLRFIITVALIAWFFRSFVGAAYNIPSGSMLPTLDIGDYLAASKWPYGYSRYSMLFHFPPFKGRMLPHLPKRGDIVVFWVPTEKQDLIKRVIGVPGDTIAVRSGVVVLNGHALPRQKIAPVAIRVSPNSPCRTVGGALPNIVNGACLYPAFRESLPGGPTYTVLDQVSDSPADDFDTITVPTGYVFMMGDNRDDSLDSRFPVAAGGIGMIPVENLVGRAEFLFWSTDGTASYLKPWTWFSALRSDRIGDRL
jgi:signal peptidase I